MNGVLVHFCLPSEFLQLDNIMVTRSIIGVYNKSKPQLVKQIFFLLLLIFFNFFVFVFCVFFFNLWYFLIDFFSVIS